MMYSDYYALSVCAYSIVFAPFMIIAQLRFTHILQTNGYSAKSYFFWLKKNFLSVYMPLIGLLILTLLGLLLLRAYLANTFLYDIQASLGFAVEIGYMVILALICLCLLIIFAKYVKLIKIECEFNPIKTDGVFIWTFLLCSFIITVLITIENIFTGIDTLLIIMPLFTPLLAPLAAVLLNAESKERAKN